MNASVREWVLQDLLESIAVRRGLDGRPQIVRQLEMWRSHYLAEEMVRRVVGQVKATDLDVFRSIAMTDRSITQPRLSVRVATGASVSDVAVFVDALGSAPIDAVPISAPGIAIREFRNEPVERLGIVAPAAWPLTTGEWSKVTVVDSIAMLMTIALVPTVSVPRAGSSTNTASCSTFLGSTATCASARAALVTASMA